MATIPDNTYDQVIYSPVFFKQRKYNGRGNGNEATWQEYNEYLQQVFTHALRITNPTGTVVVFLSDLRIKRSQFLLPYRFAIEACNRTGAIVVNDVDWMKSNALPAPKVRWLVNHKEPVFVFAKTQNYYFDKTPFLAVPRKTPKPTERLGTGYRTLIDLHLPAERLEAHKALDQVIAEVKSQEIVGFRMRIRGCHVLPHRGMGSGPARAIHKHGFHIFRLTGGSHARNFVFHAVASRRGGKHPAIHPVSLVRMFMDAFCKPGGHICDPFMGSGTSALAALATGRTFTGIEIDPAYHADSLKTLKKKGYDGGDNNIDTAKDQPIE